MLGLPIGKLRAFPDYRTAVNDEEEAKNAAVSRCETRSKTAAFVLIFFSISALIGVVCIATSGAISSSLLLHIGSGLLGGSSLALLSGIVLKVKSTRDIRKFEQQFRDFLEKKIIKNEEMYFSLGGQVEHLPNEFKAALVSMDQECFVEFAGVAYKQIEPRTRQEGFETSRLKRSSFKVVGFEGLGGIAKQDRYLLKYIAEDSRFEHVPERQRKWIAENQFKD